MMTPASEGRKGNPTCRTHRILANPCSELNSRPYRHHFSLAICCVNLAKTGIPKAMKFQTVLLILSPFLLIGITFFVFPKKLLRISPPLTSPLGGSYSELRSMEFDRGFNLERSTPSRNIDGGLGVFYRTGFLGFDFGNLRIAIRNTNPAYHKYAKSPRGSGQTALVIDPPRIPSPPSPYTIPPGMPFIIPSELARGTRVICDGKTFDFIEGEVVINGSTYSAITSVPTLVVLDSHHVTEHVESLPVSLFPAPESARPRR